MSKFTVILMYPDYLTDSEGYGETWCGTVEAENPVEAVEEAQVECASQRIAEDEQTSDFKPISVFAGDRSA